MNVISSNISNTNPFLDTQTALGAGSNGFKNGRNISMDAAVDISESSADNTLRNPYNIDQVSDEAWGTFVKATKGYPQIAVESTQKLLFENSEFSNSITNAMTLLDWSKRADVIKENIALPLSTSSEISESQKKIIADQLKMLIDAQQQILGNFGYLAKNGGFQSIDLVA